VVSTAARTLVGTGIVVVAVAGVGLATAAGGNDDGVLGPGPVTVEVGVEHSAFDRSTIQVEEGTEVRFVVANGDPILHELIVGPPEVHRRHAEGTEAEHAPVPGEVTVRPLSTAETTYRFDEPGSVTFACHLPGHVAYGMTGTVEVVEG
jgi:uncharacterized cupredoxin-like copper-binding protein